MDLYSSPVGAAAIRCLQEARKKPNARDNERQAIARGKDRAWLKRRLTFELQTLPHNHQKLMKGAAFDFARQRIISGDGQYAIQWRVRPYHKSPIGPKNPQSSIGTVKFVRLK